MHRYNLRKRRSTQGKCEDKMMVESEDLPIMVEGGRTVARAIIKHKHSEAVRSANAAASHVSTPHDIQLCTFSDGSYKNPRGGVGLAYRRDWLPHEWTAGSIDPSCGGMVEKAWPYGYVPGILAMEGVGILESLHAANDEIKRCLSVLTQHASTVQVKVTADCQEILRHISRTGEIPERTKKMLPPELVRQIRDLVMALQGHGIEVVVEMHWCPRNAVPQLATADELAGKARRKGLGYCTGGSWSDATESVIMKELAPMLSWVVSFARIVPTTDETEKEPEKGRRKKKGKRKAVDTEMENNEKPAKKAKTSPADEGKTKTAAPKLISAPRARPQAICVRPTMPAAWGLDPQVTATSINGPDGQAKERVPPCPFIREACRSTMETGELNVFVNDGVNLFCMARPIVAHWHIGL